MNDVNPITDAEREQHAAEVLAIVENMVARVNSTYGDGERPDFSEDDKRAAAFSSLAAYALSRAVVLSPENTQLEAMLLMLLDSREQMERHRHS
jgi:hypothetical protein